MAISKGNKGNISGAVIAVDTVSEAIQICTPGEDSSSLAVSPMSYKVKTFDKEFFEKLPRIIKTYSEKNPGSDISKATLILPDRLFLLDTLTVPVIHRKAMQQSLNVSIESIYQNVADLTLNNYLVQQGKQSVTYGLAGIRRDLLNLANDAMDEAGVNVGGITFVTNAMVDGALALNPKIKNETFLLLDIKQDVARFAFVIRGVTMGYYDLPFGHEILYKTRVVAEDTLFDHRAAELMVLNAMEKARAKQLTMGGDSQTEKSESAAEEFEMDDNASGKVGRKLPKFMQRPTPTSREEYLYENFRIFIKWALELINNNRDITSLAKFDTVYVNMPDEYRFLFDVVNQKQAGRGIVFLPLLNEGEYDSLAANLELYGGFFMNRFNEVNTF